MTLPHYARRASPSQAAFSATIAAVLCTFVLTACSPQAPQVSAAEPKSATSTPVPEVHDTARQSSPFAATKPAGAAAFAMNNYDQLLERYPESKQVEIKAWYASHAADAMSFHSNAQWQWMQQHDYPTPDDVLRASMMTETQLRELASHGDTKANFFYLTHLLDEYAQANEASTVPSQHKTRLRAKMSASMDRALASGSAFAGYLFGGYYAALYGKEAAGVGTAAGLTWVMSFGDHRPMFTNPQVSMGFPGVSGVGAAEVYFDMFASAARINPHFQNARRGRGATLMPARW